jgi:hypothetical protein
MRFDDFIETQLRMAAAIGYSKTGNKWNIIVVPISSGEHGEKRQKNSVWPTM